MQLAVDAVVARRVAHVDEIGVVAQRLGRGPAVAGAQRGVDVRAGGGAARGRDDAAAALGHQEILAAALLRRQVVQRLDGRVLLEHAAAALAEVVDERRRGVVERLVAHDQRRAARVPAEVAAALPRQQRVELAALLRPADRLLDEAQVVRGILELAAHPGRARVLLGGPRVRRRRHRGGVHRRRRVARRRHRRRDGRPGPRLQLMHAPRQQHQREAAGHDQHQAGGRGLVVADPVQEVADVHAGRFSTMAWPSRSPRGVAPNQRRTVRLKLDVSA